MNDQKAICQRGPSNYWKTTTLSTRPPSTTRASSSNIIADCVECQKIDATTVGHHKGTILDDVCSLIWLVCQSLDGGNGNLFFGQRPQQGSKSCRMGRNSIRLYVHPSVRPPSDPTGGPSDPAGGPSAPLAGPQTPPALRPLQQALRPLQQAIRPLQQGLRPLQLALNPICWP